RSILEGTPMTKISARLADSISRSGSATIVLPATTAMPASPARTAPSTVCGPIDGKSNRRSCAGFGAFTKAPVPNRARRRPLPPHPRSRLEIGLGSFCRLDRQHMTARYHHRLSDIEVSCGAQVIETQRDVGAVLLGGLRMTECAFRDQNIRRNLMSADKAETL